MAKQHLKAFPHHKAFTLIEVMVALVILAIALMACLLTAQKVVESSAHMEQSMEAHWVASNILTQMQVGFLTKPEQEAAQGNVFMLNRHWHWEVDNLKKQANFEEVLVRVFENGKQVSSLNGFVHL